MGRKKQNPEESEKRHLVIKTAMKLFLTQGYSLVSMDAIAEAVPVSKRTLYNHFKDKKALFTAVMQARCSTLFKSLEQTLESTKKPAQALGEFGMVFLKLALRPDSINIYRTAVTEAFHFPELGSLFYESGPKRSSAILAQYMQNLDASNGLHIANPPLAAKVFLGMLTNRVQMRHMLGVQKRISVAERREIVDYAVHTFLYGQQNANPNHAFIGFLLS